jgi:mannose/fructose/N-acetylgalactosamine-specific phosphotransferase system component IID
MMMANRMSLPDRIRIFIRSLTIQGSWNFPQMQGLGFFYILVPWLRKISGDRFQEAARRHFGYFNTHPFMASYIAGVVAKLEEDGKGEESAKISGHMMGPLGALGDAFFWARLRPNTILLAVAVSFFWPPGAAPVLLLVFNMFHIRERWSGITKGYLKADDPMSGFTSANKGLLAGQSQYMVMAVCGFILGAAAFSTDAPGPGIALFVLGYILFRIKLRTLTVVAALLIAGFILGMLGIGMGLPWSV